MLPTNTRAKDNPEHVAIATFSATATARGEHPSDLAYASIAFANSGLEFFSSGYTIGDPDPSPYEEVSPGSPNTLYIEKGQESTLLKG